MKSIQKRKSKKGGTYRYIPASKFCAHCEELLKGHPKCKDCNILLHERNLKYFGSGGKQHTEAGVDGKCVGCANRRK